MTDSALIKVLAAMLAEDGVLRDLYTSIEPSKRAELLEKAGMRALAEVPPLPRKSVDSPRDGG